MPSEEKLVDRALKVLEGNTLSYKGLRVIVPHKRAYPQPFCWDTAFHVMGLNGVNNELAKENIEAILNIQNESGLIPNSPSRRNDMDLRSQPPIIVYAILEYYRETKDILSIRRWYPKIIRYVMWWRREGMAFKNVNLLSPFSGSRDLKALAYKAICSTGMDNHPTYDFCNGKTFKIGKNHYITVFDLLLSSTYILALESLLILSDILGKRLSYLKEELRKAKEDYNTYLWDETNEFYFPLTWNGERIRVRSIQAIISLIAGIPDNRKAKKLVKVLEGEFMCDYGLVSISKRDPKFMSPQPGWLYSKDPYYWRGPIWPPIIVLSVIGLKRYAYFDLAKEIAEGFLRAVEKSGFAEYFTPNGHVGSLKRINFSWTAAAVIYLNKELD